MNFIGPESIENLSLTFVCVIMLGYGIAFATFAAGYFSTVFRKFVEDSMK